MGVLYIVVPLTDEVTGWLEKLGINYPNQCSSRNPFGSEIVSTLDGLTQLSIEYSGEAIGSNWQATVCSKQDPARGPWTLLNIRSFKEFDAENEICFEKGHPNLIVEILHRLTQSTGPLVLVPDTGEDPLVIQPTLSPESMLSSWEHMNETDFKE